MDGDFSKLYFNQNDNFNGVLQQQGRVLLDADWNAQTLIINHWQDTAGADIIGDGIAAVPVDEPDGFQVTAANVDENNEVKLTLLPGRIWADGLLVYLQENYRTATYLDGTTPLPSDGVRDAVILSIWREAFNGFQQPNQFYESALRGPDTTERVYTAMALRLLRLEEVDTCDNIQDKLQDNFDNKGKLTVELEPSITIDGDCPAVAAGGYTGFEHNLYRIEIAQVNSSEPPSFKWSQFNGGLVGRGELFQGNTVKITGNQAAIASSNLHSFYLEAIEYNPDLGYWQVTYGGMVTLQNNLLELPATPTFGTNFPNTEVFFRLWNSIEKISEFTGTAQLLGDGILLTFESADPNKYTPGDYWNFTVRAGDIENPQTLIDNQPPAGIHYHRVPLAILKWNDTKNITFANGEIEDCRQNFPPLTRRDRNCCTYSVGDGQHSHGDFDSIQNALDHLPDNGGQICLLPGVYTENIQIKNRKNITIKGCGDRTQITGSDNAEPIIWIVGSQHIHIQSLFAIAEENGVGILIENQQPSQHINLADLHIQAATRSAIETQAGEWIAIRNCLIEMKDVFSSQPGIYFSGEDGLIESNVIQVIPPLPVKVPDEITPVSGFTRAKNALGGLQLGGGSDHVQVINNLIQRGLGHGINLGSVVIRDQTGININKWFVGWVLDISDPSSPQRPGRIYIPPQIYIDVTTQTEYSAGDALRDIHIEGNRIFDMGLSGISVIHFFDLDATDEFITVDYLSIIGNEIRNCLQRDLEDIPPNMLSSMGYGGIALADGSYIVIRDNIIENNGTKQLEPICGIFILHGEGMEIDRNRIINNGAKSREQSPTAAKNGRRGGINIVFGITPTVPIQVLGQILPDQNGMPAIKVHNNIVSVPLGEALSLTALGPVSVVGNQFTSQGVVLTSKPVQPSFIAATVAILNLGLSNELYGQLWAFSGIRNGQVGAVSEMTFQEDAVVLPRRGLDDLLLGQYLANGNVLFSENQCVLDLLETGISGAVSSIFIISLDDISFHNNQCDANLFDDLIVAQALIFGISVRVSDNRFKEGIWNTALSAITLGIMNTTTDNQATHCLLVRGWNISDHWSGEVNVHNTVLVEIFFPVGGGICEHWFGNVLKNFGRK